MMKWGVPLVVSGVGALGHTVQWWDAQCSVWPWGPMAPTVAAHKTCIPWLFICWPALLLLKAQPYCNRCCICIDSPCLEGLNIQIDKRK